MQLRALRGKANTERARRRKQFARQIWGLEQLEDRRMLASDTLQLDFNSQLDDAGNNQGDLVFNGPRDFQVTFTDDDSAGATGGDADGVHLTNSNFGNIKVGDQNDFVIGAFNTSSGLDNYHTSGIVAQFNRGVDAVSFDDTDDDTTLKRLYAFDAAGNLIGQTAEDSQVRFSIDMNDTGGKQIHSIEFDTLPGTEGGSNDGTYFTLDNFEVSYRSADAPLPIVAGDGVSIDLYNGIGGGPAPTPATIAALTPSGTTLSPFVDFPNPGSVINVGNSFNNFFASTTTPPDQVSGLSASNFILDIDFYLRVEESMDLTPATDDIDISISVGSDDGFYLTVDNAFIGSTGDRAFSFSGFNLSFAEPGLYPVDLLFSANSVGQSGLELHWNTASTGSQLIPQSAMYVDPNVGNQQITFEELTAGAIVSDQFVDKGILFSTLGGQLQVTDAFPSDFVPVSAPYVFADPTANPTETGEVEFTFVVPGTSVPASTDLFSFYAIDAEGIGVTATAFDQTGAVLFSDTFNAGGATQDLVTIAEPGIAKVVLTLGDTTDTSAIDNITFNTPTPLLADLSASAITGSLIAQALQPLSLEYQVDNIGFATTPAGRSDVVYLSSDPQLDLGSDTPVGSLTTGDSVDVGLQETLTVSVSVPDIVPGDYFLIVNVNDDGLITEPSLSNNQVSIPVHIPASSPTINSQSPNGFTADDITRITLGLSEPVAFDGANDPASYVLTDLGPDRQLGGGDDITIPVAPAYLNGTDRIDLLPSQGATIDLNNWTEHDYSGNGGAGDWRIENGGESVKQYVNGNPTFFVSDTDFIDREFVGRIAVETTGDDDYIGIAFGFNADTTSRPDDYYLLSWKQGNQGAAEAGFKLIKMTNSAGASGVVDRLWDGENSTFGAAQLQVLARNTSNNGWADNTEYEFAIRYDSNGDIQVSIRRASDGVEFFNASVNDPDPLGPGKIGFYNYSQSLVRYSGLRQSQFLDEGTYQITAYSGDAGLANDDGVPLDGNPAVPGFEDYVGYFTIDQTPPIRQTVTPSSTGVEIEFFDAGGMDPASVETIANYTLTSTGGDGIFDNGNDLPIPIENVTFDPSTNTARLTFQDGLFDERYQLTINGVVDLAGNSIVSPDLSNFDLVTIPASVGIDLQSGSDSGVSNTDRLTNVTTPTFDVSINKAGQVEIDFDNDGVSDYLTWIANPGTLSVTAPTLIDGNYTVTATLTPPVGTSVDNNVTIEVDTMGPAVLPGAATEDAPLDRRTVMFSEAIDLSSVLPQDITMTGPSGLIPLTNGFGSGDVYTFEFDSIFAAGTYTISGSVGLRDLAGNQANQNGDALNGQPGDEPVDTFELLPDTIAPFVQSFSPTGVRRDGVDVLTVEFSEPIDPDTFDIGQVTIIGPSGPLDLSGSEIIPVSSTAGTIFWTDWISGNSTAGFTGLGTITTDSGPVSVTYNNPQGISFFQPSGGTDYWQNGGGGRNPATSPYTSDEVTNIPSGTDIIALNRAGEQSLVFSKPIANPVFSYVSLNGNGYAFDRDFDILSFGNASDGNDAGYWGSGTSFKEVVDLGDGLFEYRLLGTGEPHGTLRFKGTFDSVSWRSLSNENWNGFTVGIDAASSSILQYQITTPGLIEQDGTYVVILDQNIADVSGNPLGNDFQAAITIDTIGPRITRAVATATATDSYLDVTFDEPIDETTLGANDILFTGPPGNIDVSAPFHLGGNIYRFQFLPQTDVGTYDITIGPNVADLVGNELDQNRDGQGGQSDDVYQTSLTIELSDLVIGDLTLTPPSDIYSGQLVTVDFTTINQGGRAVSSPFSDRVQLIDSDTMTVIGTVTLPYDPAISGDLLPGSELLRTASFQLPDGLAGTGDFEIIVTTDALGSIAEANLAGDAESNNEATVTFSATLNDYPDLAPQAITGPAFIFTGTQTNVSWQTTNASTLDLQGSWTERVYLVKQNSSVQLASLNFDNESIAAGSFAVRSRQVTIPAGLEPGEWRLQVDVDTGQTVTESDETNNSALADLATVIPITLTLSAASTSVREDGNPLTLRLTRSGDISGPLTVHLDSDDLTEITVPETVTIPANQLWVEFLATPVQDATADGDRIANVTAAVLNPDGTESDSYSSDAIGLTVIDTAVPQLTLSLASGEVNEGDSLLATVSRDLSINADPMLVTLTVSSNTQLRVPISVSLDANEASTTFLIEALSDELVEIDRAYNVTAKGFGQDTNRFWFATSIAKTSH
ncbi:hypothetical protein C2E31_12300 [Rhodopirellula baltica]|nr:hypothetical protein C2E31_12300 [Rhodopirellula baltica]